mmetsp:Transcript_20177/g.56074  ORF Transcript_20177/g.56074 Transcript_20177/m.56074 type:complete len:97 (+) Transcript_20177:1141-1431(+)
MSNSCTLRTHLTWASTTVRTTIVVRCYYYCKDSSERSNNGNNMMDETHCTIKTYFIQPYIKSSTSNNNPGNTSSNTTSSKINNINSRQMKIEIHLK